MVALPSSNPVCVRGNGNAQCPLESVICAFQILLGKVFKGCIKIYRDHDIMVIIRDSYSI